MKEKDEFGLIGRIINYFIDAKITPILIIIAFFLGFIAIVKTPKDEEPQIVVPMIDILISYPGAEPEEIEKRVILPLEKKLWELTNIEYLYSVAKEGQAIVTARFYVGTDPVKALVELNSKWMSALDLAPPGVILPPLIKPKSIDDVPILTLTLWSEKYDWFELRKMALTLEEELKKLPDVAETNIIGGRPRELQVILDPIRLSAYGLSPLQIAQVLRSANVQCLSGRVKQANLEYNVKIGGFLQTKRDVENIVVGFFNGKPVYLKDVANIFDEGSEPKDYVLFKSGPSAETKGIKKTSEFVPAVTISIAKRKGTNAVRVAEKVISFLQEIKGKYLPGDVQITITRNYGETAQEKTNELLEHLFIASFSIILLIGVVLGFREALVVGIAVPVTLALALFFSMLFGFSLNRVTLFALIFCIGILVDDPIVDVENIHRWFENKVGLDKKWLIINAVNEVRAPIILATFTVISALMPMAFVTGLMGPYMRPIPINASVAMLFSLLIAIIITPWAAHRFLKTHPQGPLSNHDQAISKDRLYQFYCRLMTPFLLSRKSRLMLYFFIILLLLICFSLFYFKLVLVKMLPYDNKSEVQIVVDMPEGTPLEKTLEVLKKIANYVAQENIVTDLQIYAGTSAPFNFNGLVRHYYLRQDSHLGDIQVNLVGKHHRKEQSHDFAKRIRPKVEELGKSLGAKYVAVVEVPPGPPVLSPIVAEIYAPDLENQQRFALKVFEIFQKSPYLTDVGIYLESDAPLVRIIPQEEKLKLVGMTKEELVETIKALCQGLQVGILQTLEAEHVPILLKLPENYRSLDILENLKIPTKTGNVVPLNSIAEIKMAKIPKSIYRKNLRRVNYVIADVAGVYEAPVYGIFGVRELIKKIPNPYEKLGEYWINQPLPLNEISLKWDGEMHITLEVFRDLGLAFVGAIFVMYLLILIWFKDYGIPGVIMAPIPLTLIGIIPGHLLLNSFFTATSMIGFIALAGIIVRNSIIVVDFAEQRVQKGVPLAYAVVEAASVRTRPIFLTAIGIIVGSFVILFDPIFNGLAISLIFGTLGSTTLSLILIPLLYYGHKLKKGYSAPTKEELQKLLSIRPE